MATAAATADAALPPWPPASGSPLRTDTASPRTGDPARRSTSAAASAAVFLSARVGRSRVAGIAHDHAVRVHAAPPAPRRPRPATARPRMSRPGPTLPTEPGANARARTSVAVVMRRRVGARR